MPSSPERRKLCNSQTGQPASCWSIVTGRCPAGILDLSRRSGEDELPAGKDEGCGGAVESEFAAVAVTADTTANGPRLRLEDRSGGRVRFLDALELETIVWLPDGHSTQLLDPSADRWREA
jgi:hypothetical protein